MDHLDSVVERDESVRRLPLSSGDWNEGERRISSRSDRLEKKE